MIPTENQIDLFGPAPRLTAGPLSRSGAGPSYRARRDDGIRRAQDHAEADAPGWTEEAAAFLREYARNCSGTFLCEQARAASKHWVPEPENGKAWGAAALYAMKRGWIVKAGFGPASSSNGSPKTLFRAGGA